MLIVQDIRNWLGHYSCFWLLVRNANGCFQIFAVPPAGICDWNLAGGSRLKKEVVALKSPKPKGCDFFKFFFFSPSFLALFQPTKINCTWSFPAESAIPVKDLED